MKITKNVRKYAAEQGMTEDKVVKEVMAAKAAEFVRAGAAIYGSSSR